MGGGPAENVPPSRPAPKRDLPPAPGLPPAPEVSLSTIPMAGLLVDTFGLAELPSDPSAPVSCLWLLHPRGSARRRMHDIARRVVHAYHQTPSASTRGLIALAFDMPNHGSRMVSKTGNLTWQSGNETHAIDMMGAVKGGVCDMSGLMDVVGAYIRRPNVDGHVCLGWSLGGHAAWEAWIGETRLDAVVSVVGCPDYMGLMRARARNQHLDCGDEFFGSKYFPNDLVGCCKSHDPRGLLFGTSALPSKPLTPAERSRIAQILSARGCLRGKKLLLLSGADDKLVPHSFTTPMVKLLEEVGGVDVSDKLYKGVGHAFSADMVREAVRFLVGAVEQGPRERSKI